MVTSIQKMCPGGEIQMSCSKLSTSWARRPSQGDGKRGSVPPARQWWGAGGSEEKYGTPFSSCWSEVAWGEGVWDPEGAPRVRLRGPWGCGWEGGLPAQGKERWPGNRQSWVRPFTPTSGESFGQYIYIQNKARGCF